MARSVGITFDYRCPFAYNANLAVVNAIRSGQTEVDFRFVAFSLDQVHLDDSEVPVWERDPQDWGTGVRALLYGIAVRERFPEAFLAAHVELFTARHDKGLQLHDEEVLRDAVGRAGLRPDDVTDVVQSGAPMRALESDHRDAAERLGVFGVPTFIEGDEAAFVRLMERGRTEDLGPVLDLLAWKGLNEFKRTRIPR